jgi:hypothetical protein
MKSLENSELEKRAQLAFLKHLIKNIGNHTLEINKIWRKNLVIERKLRKELNQPYLGWRQRYKLSPFAYNANKEGEEALRVKLDQQLLKYPPTNIDIPFEYVKIFNDGQETYTFKRQISYNLADWYGIDLTSLHILYNRLRHTRPHTKDDNKHANTQTFQAIQKRVDLCFSLLQEVICTKGDNRG